VLAEGLPAVSVRLRCAVPRCGPPALRCGCPRTLTARPRSSTATQTVFVNRFKVQLMQTKLRKMYASKNREYVCIMRGVGLLAWCGVA